jgi:hypothetical protein
MSIDFTIIEQLPSRQMVEDEPGQDAKSAQLVRVFAVTASDGGVAIDTDGYTVLRYATDLPQIGEEFEDPLAPGDPTGLFVRARVARRPTTERTTQIVFVEIRYWRPDTESEPSILSDIRAQFVQWWRTEPTPQTYDGEDPDWPVGEPLDGPALNIPTVGLVDNENANDIGGKRIDIAGTPTSILRVRGQFVVSKRVASDNYDPSDTRIYLGARNSQPFFDYPPGTVVYLGARTAQAFRGAPIDVAHTFAYDQYFHMEQQPKRNGGGIIVLDANKRAAEVYWRQPFPTYLDLREVVDDGTLP